MSVCTLCVFTRSVISIVWITEILEEETDIIVCNELHPFGYINATQHDMIKPLKPKAN
jgi:hypothetical protein